MIVDSKCEVEVFDELCSSVLPIKIDVMAIYGITSDLIEEKSFHLSPTCRQSAIPPYVV